MCVCAAELEREREREGVCVASVLFERSTCESALKPQLCSAETMQNLKLCELWLTIQVGM